MLTALYRHFDKDGALLYVGISLSPINRLSEHSKGSHWSVAIGHVTVQWYDTRQEALDAERMAISEERPRHNITHNRPGAGRQVVIRPRVPEYVDMLEQVAAHFRIGLRTVQAMVRDGMPREQLSARKFRYDLRAIEDWALERGRRHAEQKKAEAAERHEERVAIMREALDRAFTKK